MKESYEPFKPYKPKSKFKKFMNKHRDFIVMPLIPFTICAIILVFLGYNEYKKEIKCEANGGINVGYRTVVCVKPDSIIDYNKGDK